MRTLAAYLWKEWRDHRAVILGFLVAIPLLVAFAEWLVPQVARHPRFAGLSACAGLAILLLAVVAELIPGETRRETVDFLLRMPADLRAAFLAKALFLVAVLGLGAGHGFLSAWVLARPPTIDPEPFAHIPWLLALGLWVVPVSSWVPRGALAVPATAALFAALAAPVVALAARGYPALSEAELGATRVALALGAAVASLWSFLRGYRFGGGAWNAAWRGLAVAGCLALPAYAYAAVRIAGSGEIDPRREDFRIGGAQLGPDQRIAFIEAQRSLFAGPEGPPATIIADLVTGAWRVEPGLVVERAPGVFARGDVSGSRIASFHDGRTGEALAGRVAQDGEALARERTPHRTAAGGRVWTWGDRVRWERPGGTVAAAKLGSPHPCGLGFRNSTQSRVFDFSRERIVEREVRGPLFVRPGRWLAWTVRHKVGAAYELIDPETGERSPAKGLGPRDVIGPPLQDARVLVLPRDDRPMVALDPETGASEALAVEPGSFGRAIEVTRPLDGVYRIRFESGEWVYARLEGARFLCAAGATGRYAARQWGTLQALARSRTDELYCVEDSRRIVALRFGTNERRVLFPR